MPEKPAYFSRFALKFSEILGAGIATAVGGYLVAHVGAYLSSPSQAPTAAIEAQGGNAKPAERPRNHATAAAPADTDAHTATVRDDHGKEPIHSAAKPAEISAPVTAASVVKDEDEKHSRGAVTSRKPVDAHSVKPSSKETADTKPAAKESGDAKPTPKETADAKPTPKEAANAKAREQEAVEEQIRAALANVDASRTPASNSPTLPAETPAPQTAAIPEPPPIPASDPAAHAGTANTPTSAVPIVAVPAAGPVPSPEIQNTAATATAPSVSASAQQTVPEPGPLATIEIKSRPVAGVEETKSAAQGTAPADDELDGKPKSDSGKGLLSAIVHIPDFLRANARAPAGEPPRPPLPVGE